MSNFLKRTKRASEELAYDEIHKPFITDYSKAWENYKMSNSYDKSVEQMIKHGMKQPYVDNILRLSFDAGWNAR